MGRTKTVAPTAGCKLSIMAGRCTMMLQLHNRRLSERGCRLEKSMPSQRPPGERGTGGLLPPGSAGCCKPPLCPPAAVRPDRSDGARGRPVIAVLLCAGYGTRLFPLTRNFPKPLLPVAGRPVLDYLMVPLTGLAGLRQIHLVTNARFIAHFESWRDDWRQRLGGRGPDVVLHNDGSTEHANRLGACTDLKLVFDRVDLRGGSIVAAGDNILGFELKPLWDAFRQGGPHRIVALPEADSERLRKTGVPVFGAGNRVLALAEKPEAPPTRWCSPALYFLRPSALTLLAAFLRTAEDNDSPGHFIDYLCRRERVEAFRLNARRIDIGDPADYRRADDLLRHTGCRWPGGRGGR